MFSSNLRFLVDFCAVRNAQGRRTRDAGDVTGQRTGDVRLVGQLLTLQAAARR